MYKIQLGDDKKKVVGPRRYLRETIQTMETMNGKPVDSIIMELDLITKNIPNEFAGMTISSLLNAANIGSEINSHYNPTIFRTLLAFTSLVGAVTKDNDTTIGKQYFSTIDAGYKGYVSDEYWYDETNSSSTSVAILTIPEDALGLDILEAVAIIYNSTGCLRTLKFLDILRYIDFNRDDELESVAAPLRG